MLPRESRGKPRALQIVSANVTSWRAEHRQWIASQRFGAALIQEHHLSEGSLRSEMVAMSQLGYHVHGKSSPVRKSDIGGVLLICAIRSTCTHAKFRNIKSRRQSVDLWLSRYGSQILLSYLFILSQAVPLTVAPIQKCCHSCMRFSLPSSAHGVLSVIGSLMPAIRLEDITKSKLQADRHRSAHSRYRDRA